MAAISTIIAGVGLGLGAVGAGVQYAGQRRAQAGAERAERLRQAQTELESQRQRRNIARQATVARATALSNSSAQGAEGGTGLQGGYGQIQGQAGNAMVAVNQNQDMTRNMFAFNRQISRGQTQTSMGSGLSSLGGALVNNSETIGRVGSYTFGIRGT